jgi:cell division protein ZapA (FtsZ GTPase activity inhibitor)
MKADDKVITFEILDERFTIRADVSKDYYRTLVDYLNKKINNIKNKVSNLSKIKILTFAALDIIDELVKLKNTSLDKDEVEKLSRLSDSLASVIDDNEMHVTED